ncbi:MAG: fructosamine kinase family protein [Bacteroidetes bacterium]|nr:fructosamine kinase family protein [Bacteroidota bacterium]
MPLPRLLIDQLSERLSAALGTTVDVEEAIPVGGGSINDAYRLGTDAGTFFVKTNQADRFPSLFEAEADGLERLRRAGALRVPRVIAFGEEQDTSYLLLEHIGGGGRDTAYWEELGRGLARLHAHTAPLFGLERSNYIGSLVQVNTPHASWPDFFIHCRLEPLVKRARDKQRIDGAMALRFERLFARLDHLFPQEPPALLHGDLWSGNILCAADGAPVLIDPAVYYGHREMDLAMTKLFGGFEDAFYGAYQAERPMEPGWRGRMDLCNLYPLLGHALLFGGSYAAQADACLKRFL